MDNIINFNTSKYINLFLRADKIISSISDSWLKNPLGTDTKYIKDLFHFEFIYLNNGIIKDDLSNHLNRLNKHFNLIVVSTKLEYNSILKYDYGYNKNNLILTGLPRFDYLQRAYKNIELKKIILLFPTWRMYIKGTKDLITSENIVSESFKNTTYYKFYNSLINDKNLINIFDKYNYFGIFCLHPNFAGEYKLFEKNKYFDIIKRCDQQIILKSKLLITDYSSVFFDFGYLGKPIIYTHFDYIEYRNYHFKKGYFDYELDGFGPICYDIKCTIKNIMAYIENNCIIKNFYLRRIKKFFKFADNHNCFRTYNRIVNNKNNNNHLDYIIIFDFFIISFITLLKLYNNKNENYFINIII
jgi:CDP-glycerol glycerophosphotransferase (TagB/SpsB family)